VQSSRRENGPVVAAQNAQPVVKVLAWSGRSSFELPKHERGAELRHQLLRRMGVIAERVTHVAIRPRLRTRPVDMLMV
jgi:hypothetical protein